MRPVRVQNSYSLFLLALVLTLAGAGCLPGYVHVTVQGPPHVNRGLPLRMLVRAVARDDYRIETYESIAARVIAPDSSVLRSFTLYPEMSIKQSFWIKTPAKNSLAVYFLFSQPKGSWSLLLEPRYPWSIDIPLRGMSIDATRITQWGGDKP